MRCAYLIMAHDRFEILEKLLSALDYSGNDIYIHIDKKTKAYPKEKLISVCRFSKIHFIDSRIRVTWGGYSQIEAELALLTEASKGNYDYYHFISGIDMPLIKQSELHSFLEQHLGTEFISLNAGWAATDGVKIRYQLFYPFQETVGRNYSTLLGRISHRLQVLQQKIGVCRNKAIRFEGGSSYFSITHELVLFLLSNKKKIHKLFSATSCCDEIFLQTIIADTKFEKKIFDPENPYRSNMRMIDFKRGNPYTFTIDDWQELLESKKWFVRKVGSATEKERQLLDQLLSHTSESKSDS